MQENNAIKMKLYFIFVLFKFYLYYVSCSFSLLHSINQFHQAGMFSVPVWVGKQIPVKVNSQFSSTPGEFLKNSPEVSTITAPNVFKNSAKNIPEGSFCRRSFDNRGGYCIEAHQCLHVVREHRLNGVKIDICTYQKGIPIICCPLDVKDTDRYKRISARKCEEYHEAVKDVDLGKELSFSGRQCVESLPLIVGGESVRVGEYPHMAALGWSQPDKSIKWSCGGSLISEQYILTAGHCTELGGKPPNIVRLGAKNLSATTDHTQDIKIRTIIQHPKYRASMYYHDIALLKLSRPVAFTKEIRPACLWQYASLDVPRTTATGWGHTEFMGPKSDDLQKVDLNMVDQKICRDIYNPERRLPKGLIDEQFCAGHMEGGKDTCQGDSGGPLNVELPELNCVQFVIGLTSFGKFCAAPNAPGVYTNVFAYLDWIEKIVFK